MNHDEYKNVEPVCENGDEVTASPKTGRAVGYRITSVLLFLFAAGGLFLGMLGTVLPLFSPRLEGASGIFASSLLGYIIDRLTGLPAAFSSLTGVQAIVDFVVIYGLTFLLMIAVLASLVCMVVGLASAKRAKKCMHASALFTFVSYAGLFLYALTVSGFELAALGLANAYTMDMVDVPLLVVAGVALLILFITALAERKGAGLLNILLTLLSFAGIILFMWPGTDTSFYGMTAVSMIGADADLFVMIASLLVIALFLFNFYATGIRICAKRAYAFDAVRYTLQFLAVALLVVASVVTTKEWAILKGAVPIATVVVIFLTMAIAIISAIVVPRSKKRVAEQEEVTETALIAAPEQTEIKPGIPAAHAPAAEPVSAPVAEPVHAAVAPVYVPPVPAPVQEKEEPKTEFERYMEALAKGEAPANEPSREDEREYRQPVASYPVQSAHPASVPVQDYPSQYTYDPFINTLTPAEKNEFGDIFIANKYGAHNYLPPYVIGGDNSEFFRKVFIFLGRFRKDISRNLLDKLYVYVSQLK